MKFEIKYKELTEYLKTLNRKDFQNNWNKNPNAPMKEGHAMIDIDFFKMDKYKISIDTIINYGSPFLVDAVGNDLSIMILSKRKYKLPTGRAVNAKFDRTIIDDCREIYGTSLSGYWIIPERFLSSI